MVCIAISYWSLVSNWSQVSFFVRYGSMHTNLGRLMETYGPRLLGLSYKDPITSYSLFQKFSVQNLEVCPDIYAYILQRIAFSFEFNVCK